MSHETKEEIMGIIKNYDTKRLMNTYNYVCNCKNNLAELVKNNKELMTPNYEKLIEHFRIVEDCISDKIFEGK